MNEKRLFVIDWLQKTWSMVDLCEHYGVSRKTGYKWLERFKEEGLEGMKDRSRSAQTRPNETPEFVASEIVGLRRKHPYWGPRKLKARLTRLKPGINWPAASTIGDLLKREGLSRPRRRIRRTPIYSGPFCSGPEPNEVWAADFKGWFRTGNGARIDPLTVTDSASRYLVHCRAVPKADGETVKDHLTTAFLEYGMPKALRTDNGAPFATRGVAGLSRLSVWLVKLGVRPERIRPGHPEENGIHERMHKTLKEETADPPRANECEQQREFDRFLREYNEQRPHEALEMRTPSQAYRSSPRKFPGRLPEIEYPSQASQRMVGSNGMIKWRNREIFIGNAFVGERVGVFETGNGLWDVRFGPVTLGGIDQKDRNFKSLIRKKVSPMCPV